MICAQFRSFVFTSVCTFLSAQSFGSQGSEGCECAVATYDSELRAKHGFNVAEVRGNLAHVRALGRHGRRNCILADGERIIHEGLVYSGNPSR